MASDSDIRAWAKELGEKVTSRGKVSDHLRTRYEAAHPDADGIEDFDGGIVVVEAPEPSSSREGVPPVDGGSPPSPPDGGPPPGPDEPPAHARRERTRRTRSDAGQPRRITRVTQATRGDIEAKIAFALEIPGRVWEARDPVCGGTFIQARPDIASALTEIVCQSPDLIAWFTGQGGQFMLYLNLAAACWPVVTVAMAHHVYHTVELEQAEPQGDGQQPDYSRYAA